jgi:adenylate kinase
MDEGKLVPDDLVISMILDEIEEKGQEGFLLDGYPRTIVQADKLAEALEDSGRKLSAALYIDADDETVVERLSGRRVCPNGHLYHVEFDPPKHDNVCDQDGRQLVQRDDDKEEKIRTRLETYHRETEPLIEYYDERGLLRRFDGSRRPEEVHDLIRATLGMLRFEEKL